jgi:hypothetical protein
MNEHEWEPIIDENHMLRPMCDQVRMRASGGVFGDWQVVPEPARTVAAWRKARMAHEYEFRRRVAAKPSDGDEWITDPSVTIQRGDLYRVREDSHHDYCQWRPADHYEGTEVGDFAAFHSRDIQFCRPAKPAVEPAPEQPPAPTTDRGSKYHRTIRQTLPGDTHGLCLTVDVYDVCRAFGVTCSATQHAIKKLLCPGLRGAKTAEQDISEAANSCRRAIELLEFDL